jgi:hypothetical protein
MAGDLGCIVHRHARGAPLGNSACAKVARPNVGGQAGRGSVLYPEKTEVVSVRGRGAALKYRPRADPSKKHQLN